MNVRWSLFGLNATVTLSLSKGVSPTSALRQAQGCGFGSIKLKQALSNNIGNQLILQPPNLIL